MVIKKKKFLLIILGLASLLYILLSFLTPFSKSLRERSLKAQINYIAQELKEEKDLELQRRFPEGLMFANALFSLSLMNFDGQKPFNDVEKSKLIENCIERIHSPVNLEYFDQSLTAEYGAFFQGWSNYVLKKYIHSDLFKHSIDKQKFLHLYRDKTALLEAVQSDSAQVLESYYGSVWPADNLACISSLPDTSMVRSKWLQKIKENSEHPLGLINHDNYDKKLARGSSQSLIMYFLYDIDSTFAISQNAIFQEEFMVDFLGISLVKEGYEMDVDSGPVLFKIGSVATIMNVIGQKKYGDNLHSTTAFLNLIGAPVHIRSRKFYLFKKELMFDIFMLWVMSSLNN